MPRVPQQPEPQPETTAIAPVVDTYDYLLGVANTMDEQSTMDGGTVDFPTMSVMNPNPPAIGTVRPKTDEFYAPGWPALVTVDARGREVEGGYTLLSFYPLLVLPNARVAFMDERGIKRVFGQGEKAPPVCMSETGLVPVTPLSLAEVPNQVITSCMGCPYYGRKSEWPCNNRGILYGLADLGGELHPFVWFVPKTSCDNLNRMVGSIKTPVRLPNGARKAMPILRKVDVEIESGEYRKAVFTVRPFVEGNIPDLATSEEIRYWQQQAVIHHGTRVQRHIQNRVEAAAQAAQQESVTVVPNTPDSLGGQPINPRDITDAVISQVYG